MELGALSYFSTNLFWFATSMSLVVMFLAGYWFTGPTSGRMKFQINFANSGNKLKLFTAFLLSQVVLNLILISASSVV